MPRVVLDSCARGTVILDSKEFMSVAVSRAVNPFDEMPPKDAAAQGTSGGGGGHGGDRLSGLQDEVLFRVMSYLKAWEAVHMCVLSKRWRNLWSSPSADFLDIRQPCLCHRGGGSLPAHRLQAREEKFAAFVKNLLLRR